MGTLTMNRAQAQWEEMVKRDLGNLFGCQELENSAVPLGPISIENCAHCTKKLLLKTQVLVSEVLHSKVNLIIYKYGI